MRGLFIAAVLMSSGVASAHIHLTQPLARTDSLTGDQKDQHCGVPNQVRNPARVTTFTPGETITVSWMETINHTGYYRISFQPDGDVFRIPPPGPNGGFPDENLTGMVDPGGTGSIILADRIPDGTLTTTVTLPNMECNNCTLQFIQVMTDAPPYTTDINSNDIYFNCADIALVANGAPDAGPTGMPDAGVDNGGGSNNPGGEISGGCSAGGGAGLLALFGLAGLRRRRR